MKKCMARILSIVLMLAVAFSCSLTMEDSINAAKKAKNKKVKSVAVTNIVGKKLVLGKGKKFKLKTKVVLAAGSKAGKKVNYKSNKPAVASVSKKGLLKGKKLGKAKITVSSKADPKKKFTFQVTVKKKNQNVTKITLNTTEVTLYLSDEDFGDDVTCSLKATVTPKTATNQTLSWSSSNPKAAVVDSGGLVTAKADGTTTITVKATDGSGKKAVCKVTVVDDRDDYVFDDEDDGTGTVADDDDEYDDDDDDLYDDEDDDF